MRRVAGKHRDETAVRQSGSWPTAEPDYSWQVGQHPATVLGLPLGRMTAIAEMWQVGWWNPIQPVVIATAEIVIDFGREIDSRL
jgi:hypothetical protein